MWGVKRGGGLQPASLSPYHQSGSEHSLARLIGCRSARHHLAVQCQYRDQHHGPVSKSFSELLGACGTTILVFGMCWLAACSSLFEIGRKPQFGWRW